MVNCNYCGKDIKIEKSLTFKDNIYCNLVCANVCKCVKCGKIDKLENFKDLFHCSKQCKEGIKKETFVADISNIEDNLKKENLVKIEPELVEIKTNNTTLNKSKVKEIKEEDFLNWVYIGNKYLKESDDERIRILIERIKLIDVNIYKKYNIKLDLNRLVFIEETDDLLIYGGMMRGIILNKKSGKRQKIYDLTDSKGSLKNLLNIIEAKNRMIYLILLYIIDLRRSPIRINTYLEI